MNELERTGRLLAGRLDELAGPAGEDYLDHVLATTGRMRQRPAWTFAGRWLPMAAFAGRTDLALPIPWRPLAGLLVALAVVLAAAAAFVGSRPHLPAPFGPATNGRIAYAAGGDIWTIAPDGSDPRVIADGIADDSAPRFSPDGTRIAFQRGDGPDHVRIVVADADGSNAREVTTEPLLFLTGLAWAPDGRSIALAANLGGRPSIAIAQADGSGMSVLDFGMAVDSPAWRPPDGRELLVRGHPVSGLDLLIADADGSDPRPLGLERSGHFYSYDDLQGPTWSPDGSWIAYFSPQEKPGGGNPTLGERGAFKVHIVGADGSGDHVLTTSSSDVDEVWPLWSPDGRSLAIQRVRDGMVWVGVVPIDGDGDGVDAGPRVAAAQGVALTWAPDGTALLAAYAADASNSFLDPITGASSPAPWSGEASDWQRSAP